MLCLFLDRAPFKVFGLVVLLCLSLAQATPWNMDRDSEENIRNLARIQYQNGLDSQDSKENSNLARIEYNAQDSEESSSLARVQWQNRYDAPLSKVCQGVQGMYKVSSVFSGHHSDRAWKWECRSVGSSGHKKQCSSTGYVNDWNQPMFFFMCPANQYIAGVESIHADRYEDRRWKFTCCAIPNHITLSCISSGFVNSLKLALNFQAGEGEVITGVYSERGKEKR